MSFKYCSYFNCENFVVNGVSNGDFTLFQFPKDVQRRNKWMDLGGVKHQLSETLYMCSKHFDKRYVSVNSRRTALVGPAVPMDYRQLKEDITSSGSGQVKSAEVENLVESTTKEMKIKPLISQKRDRDGEEEIEFVLAKVVESDAEDAFTDDLFYKEVEENIAKAPANKRKIMNSELSVKEELEPTLSCKQSNTLVRQRIKMEASFPSAPKSKKVAANTSSAAAKDSEAVTEREILKGTTTFIFKNAEYVQMLKDDYVAEKMRLLNEIERLRKVIRSIRESVNSIID